MKPNPLWPESGPPFIPEDVVQFQGSASDDIEGGPLISDGIGELLLTERFGPAAALRREKPRRTV